MKKPLEYWKQNAEENYLTTPISVLRYISELENRVKQLPAQDVENDFVSDCCTGEKCNVCGKSATNKLSEVIFNDDPHPFRHELTAYVCKEHFRLIVGNNCNITH